MNSYSRVALLSSVLLLAACGLGGVSQPSRFYVLGTEPGPVLRSTEPGQRLAIGVGPIALPDILDRPQIVTQAGTHRVDLAEFNRWGGDLGENLSRVLAQNLMQRLNTDSVIIFPWQSRNNPDLQVGIRFFQFGGKLGKPVSVTGIWRILDTRRGCQPAIRRFDISATPANSSYSAYVEALSHSVAVLSQALAEQISETPTVC